MYLTGDAKLWWRTRMEDDAESGRPQITTWETLKKELKDQFLPTNTAWVAREALKRLRHTESVREYVKEFSSLMLDIKNMSEEDKLFNFMSGLQGWAQTELRRQGVRDLPAAMAAADCLVDYKMGGAISTTQRPRSEGGKKAKFEGKTSQKSGWKKQGHTRLQEYGGLLRNHPLASASVLPQPTSHHESPVVVPFSSRLQPAICSVLLCNMFDLLIEPFKIEVSQELLPPCLSGAQLLLGFEESVGHIWRHYLLGSIFTVVTDNVANTFFKTQKKLSPRQARWQEFLADFNFEWLHRPGRHNTVADVLSRKELITYITALSEVISDFNEKIKHVAEQDAAYGRLKQQVKEGVIRRYWLEGDLLVAKGGRCRPPSGWWVVILAVQSGSGQLHHHQGKNCRASLLNRTPAALRGRERKERKRISECLGWKHYPLAQGTILYLTGKEGWLRRGP
ncbi:hypothetical protein CK203_075362 [Vitis vinifera]|uniref:Retrotransposon gag domain-containing protein n=1 Tax=Vitis vinifera TaxID=29760 RepID=A0A438BXA8_VITVI|nr:hypothetical protein CK203_075362 [Vitis vinifera]